ncbi:amidohydrolase family protein [Bradyrhizobium sp. GCM10027634]|uniref:amidohydrolase family protein n=1 Tax=unclassified Bradyrhizobium TaxID=2631580 RepID=UPI00188C4F70|nr:MULTISPECIES: amidohydrolase family protein [unclassified Bradyrhizobium]MDN5005613.1 amidohydrolase family protein [Bradyrhizobium sp. WYCCWR 12677]QOZ44597.1 2-pyrone-4,6-dicarboxylate hydrolase [Bradyrhizobium sp. CCBAU 53340]
MIAGSIPTVPAPSVTAPARALPSGACDAHSHVFGPFGSYPPIERSVYALPEAGPEIHAAARGVLGVARGVLTQPAPYASDPSAMLAAIASAPQALRGVAVTDESIDGVMLERWRAGGIAGLRFTEMRTPSGERYPGSVGVAALHALAPRMRELGMHAQLWATASQLVEHLPALLRLGVPLVVDHMGNPNPDEGPDGPAFARIVDLLADGALWIKLVVCRLSAGGADYARIQPLHDRLVERAPHRLVWGSDWPYVRIRPAPDAGRLADLFQDWLRDVELIRRILVVNPTELYDFKEEEQA